MAGLHASRRSSALPSGDRLDECFRSLTALNKTEFSAFLKTLYFLVNSPDIGRLQRDLRRNLRLIHCGEHAYEHVLEAIAQWAVDDEKKRITRDDVEQLLNPQSATPANEFNLPDYRVDRVELKQEINRRIDERESGYIVVLGSPGSGKSTTLNTLTNCNGLATAKEIIVYNCFTGTSDQFLRTRALANNFARFLCRRLYESYRDFGPVCRSRPKRH